MLYAIIDNSIEKEPTVIKMPRLPLVLDSYLKNLGINKSCKELNLAEAIENEIYLMSDDNLWKKFIGLCKETDTLDQINNIALSLEYAYDEIKHDLDNQVVQGKFTSLTGLQNGIEYLKRCYVKFYYPVTVVRFLGKDGKEKYCDSSILYDYVHSIKEVVRKALKWTAKYRQNDAVRKKIKTIKWGVDRFNRQVYVTVAVRSEEPLIDEEVMGLTDWITNQINGKFRDALEGNPIQMKGGKVFLTYSNENVIIKNLVGGNSNKNRDRREGLEISMPITGTGRCL